MRESLSSTSTGDATSKLLSRSRGRSSQPPTIPSTPNSRWLLSAPLTSRSFSSLPTRNPQVLPTQPASIRTHRSPTLPYQTAGCPGPWPLLPPRTHTGCIALVARRGSPTRLGAPTRPTWAQILRRSQYTQHQLDSSIPQSVGAYPRRSRSLPYPCCRGDPISKHTQRRRYPH